MDGPNVDSTSVSSLLAAVAGALASLSFVPGLPKWQAALSVITGTGAAIFLAPVLAAAMANYITISAPVERGLTFSVGLFAMAVLPGLMRFAQRVAENPLSAWRGNSSGEDR